MLREVLKPKATNPLEDDTWPVESSGMHLSGLKVAKGRVSVGSFTLDQNRKLPQLGLRR